MDYLQDTKTLLGVEDAEKDAILTLIINDCINRALAYCRIEEVPEKMQSMIPLMAAAVYRLNSYGQTDMENEVTAWTQGDRSVSYESGAERRRDWLNDFKERLEPFRRRTGRVPSEIKN